MGRINKTKAGVALLAGLVGFGATGVAVAQGGLTANLALSGTFFKISMTHLEGEGLSIFTDGEQMAEEAVPVARVKFEHAYASNLCLSAALPDVPLVGESTFTLKALILLFLLLPSVEFLLEIPFTHILIFLFARLKPVAMRVELVTAHTN